MAPERTVKIAKMSIFHNSGVCLNGESPSNQVPSEYKFSEYKSLVDIYEVNDVPLWNKVNKQFVQNINNSKTK